MQRNVDHIPATAAGPGRPGPYLAKIISHIDPSYMGMLEVEILRPVGNSGDGAEGQLHQVKMISPFYGVTGVDHVTPDPNDYNNTQKSYGMWFVPPDVGTTVMVFFIDGDSKRGYWFGCVPEEAMNFMIPGIASTEYTTGGKGRVPVAEYNKKASSVVSDPTKVKKPRHPLADILEAQGLLNDDTRGITSSSARREVPSSVFGISTPGPVDKRSGAKRGKIGKKEHRVTNAFVSRLSGATFVMDDGDDKFLRKKPAKSGPPEYVAVEQGQSGGDPTIPHNELVRLRTRTGHQILLHNSEDLIYIGNARGTAWIELTSNGKIDIYSKDSISIHTENDFNLTAGRDINLCSGRAVNFSSTSSYTPPDDIPSTPTPINRPTSGLFMSGEVIHLNTPAAGGPAPIRVPQAEPWKHHEHLDPSKCTPDKTDVFRNKPDSQWEAPKYYKKYTTETDTFSKIKPPEKNR